MIAGRGGNLPAEVTTFVGRRREVTELRRTLTESRLVTLVGPGGVGKTRLALRVAGTVRRTVRDGVWLVELDGLHDPALIEQTVARALGLLGQVGQSPLEALIAYLADRHLLLLLDNCEHLIEAAAKLTDVLLRSCPRLTVMATSREALRIDAEVLMVVAPLSVPDPAQAPSLPALSGYEAVALFVERAALVVTGFALDADNREAIAEICYRLDGLPLAVELTVAWLRTLTPQQLCDRLAVRLAGAGRGRRAGPERHQTLWKCIGWSYELCTSLERQLWARLSVFAGAFDLDTATEVCADPDIDQIELLELTSSLLDKSILVREERDSLVRYRMLDSVRAYGVERLHESGQEATIRRRHRDRHAWFIRRCHGDWLGSLTPEWFTRLDREHPDVRAALEFSLTEPGEARSALAIAGSLHPFWTMRGLTTEGRYWLERAFVRDRSASAEAVDAAYSSTLLAALQGDFAAANVEIARARAIAAELGDPLSRAITLNVEGSVAVHSGDLERARRCHEAALASYQALGDQNWSTLALVGVATLKTLVGEFAEVAALYQEVLAVTEPRDEAWLRSHALWVFGIALWKRGELDQAAERIEQCLRLSQRMGSPLRASWCVEVLAWVAASRGQPDRAAVLLGAAEALARSVGAPGATTYYDLLAYHEDCTRRTRGDLGDAEYTAAVEQGAVLPLDEAISYALDNRRRAEPPSVTAAPDRSGTTQPVPLTRREREVCQLVAEGLSNQQVATRLVISRRTAESHVQNVMCKLGFTKRTQIAVWVAEHRPQRQVTPRQAAAAPAAKGNPEGGISGTTPDERPWAQ